MIGYKAFDKNLCCRGMQYEVGRTYEMPTKKEDMRLCSDNVLHFCRYPWDIERHSDYSLSNSRICEVIATGDVISNDEGKFGTNKLLILREIIGEEKNKLLHYNSGDWNSGDCNSGNRNSGNCNSGNRNSGYRNSGNCNSGNWNSGDWNSGYRNSGNWNSGDWNSGNRNSGNRNSGNRNSGDWNSGDWNSGYCNSDSPKVRMFNKMTKLNFDDIAFPNYFYEVSPVRFISADTATYEQQKEHKKDIETCGGYYEKVEYKEAWRIAWNATSDEDRRKTLSLPNFDADIFEEITGIDVYAEFGIMPVDFEE